MQEKKEQFLNNVVSILSVLFYLRIPFQYADLLKGSVVVVF